MGENKYNQPGKGSTDWDVPLNENFRDLGIEVTGEVATFDDLPTPDPNHTSSHGEPRKILVQDSRVVYRDDGSQWVAVAGLGTSDARIPGTVYHETHDTTAQVVNGSRIFVQATEPENPAVDDVWIDTS